MSLTWSIYALFGWFFDGWREFGCDAGDNLCQRRRSSGSRGMEHVSQNINKPITCGDSLCAAVEHLLDGLYIEGHFLNGGEGGVKRLSSEFSSGAIR